MRTTMTADRWLGLACIVLACLIVFVWVPLDTGTGIAEKVRRKWELGDALAPTVAGAVLGLAGLLLLLGPPGSHEGVKAGNVAWLVGLLVGLACILAVMRWSGPLATALAGLGEYRALRDTVPWKYVGFLLGGTGLIAGLICIVERRLSWRRVILALVATAIIAALYDLPFEDLLLPPNGDV